MKHDCDGGGGGDDGGGGSGCGGGGGGVGGGGKKTIKLKFIRVTITTSEEYYITSTSN